MLRAGARDFVHAVRRAVGNNPYAGEVDAFFLSKVNGLIHVGANVGQERYKYDHFGLDVVWVEPLPDVFALAQPEYPPAVATARVPAAAVGR